MTFHELNLLPEEALKKQLFRCCGSTAWVNKMLPFFPMDDLVEMLEDAEEQWYACNEADWREAFASDPKVGSNEVTPVKEVPEPEPPPSGKQGGVNETSQEVLTELAAEQEAYEKKFGYRFIVAATGSTAEAILQLLRIRLSNLPEEELRFACEEQYKIMSIRLQKLIA